jgi:hypothetical protein
MGAKRTNFNLVSCFPTLTEKLDSAPQKPVIPLGFKLLDLCE